MPTIAGISTATVLAGVGAAATVGSALSSFMGGQNKAPKPATPPTAPQPSQAPQAQGVLAGIQANGGAPSAGPGGGQASTFLSGAGGVAPSTLTLGRNALLGM